MAPLAQVEEEKHRRIADGRVVAGEGEGAAAMQTVGFASLSGVLRAICAERGKRFSNARSRARASS